MLRVKNAAGEQMSYRGHLLVFDEREHAEAEHAVVLLVALKTPGGPFHVEADAHDIHRFEDEGGPAPSDEN